MSTKMIINDYNDLGPIALISLVIFFEFFLRVERRAAGTTPQAPRTSLYHWIDMILYYGINESYKKY